MSRILALIKIDLNTTFSLSAFKYKMMDKKDRVQTIVLIFALLSLIPMYSLLISFLENIYSAYANIGQKSMFLLTGILFSQLIILFFGIIYVMSKYYFSNDLNILVPLPLKPKDIIGAKFVSLMVYEYITLLPLLLPFIIIYGINEDVNILYWLYSIIVLFFLPIIPLSISSIIVMFFMKYTNIKGRKDLLRTVGYFLLIIVLIMIQIKIQSVTQESLLNDENFLYSILTDSNSLVEKMGIMFPPSMWAVLSLSNLNNITGVLYLLLFIAISLAVFLLMIGLSEKIFFSGLIGSIEESTSKKSTKVSSKDFQRESPVYLAIAMKEIKMLSRTPVYLINSIGGVILVPILVLISTITQSSQSLNGLRIILENNQSLINLIGAGFIALLGGLNNVCCTTFSREGKNMWIQRVMPIRVKDQIIGRLLSSIFVQIIGIVAVCGSLAYIGSLTLEGVFIITILGLLGSIPTGEIGMIVDGYRPLLNWKNPQVAMKQNLNVLINLGILSLYAFAVGMLVYKLINILDMMYIYIIITVIFIVSSYVFYILLKKVVQRQFETLD